MFLVGEEKSADLYCRSQGSGSYSTAKVSGRISHVDPNLEARETIPAGTLVVRIDAEDYAHSLRQTREDLKASGSSLKELGAEEASVRRSLELAESGSGLTSRILTAG